MFDQNMSNFIATKEQISSHPIIHNKIRKVVFNPLTFRNSLNTLPSCKQQRQKSLLKHICNRFNIEQSEKIRIQAHEQAIQQILNLKQKLRKNITNENIAVMMGDKKVHKLDILSKVMRVPSQTISIDRLYRKKINLRLELMEEAQTIVKKKAEYQRWYDSIKNHNTNSPIFKKINFLLEKISKRDNKVLLSRNSVATELLQVPMVSNYNKINRKKTEGCDIAKL